MISHNLYDYTPHMLTSNYKSQYVVVHEWKPTNFYVKKEEDVGVYSSFITGNLLTDWGTQAYGGFRLDTYKSLSGTDKPQLMLQSFEALMAAGAFLNFKFQEIKELEEKIVKLENLSVNLFSLPHQYYALKNGATIFSVLRSDGAMFNYGDFFCSHTEQSKLNNLKTLNQDIITNLVRIKDEGKRSPNLKAISILTQKINTLQERYSLESNLPIKQQTTNPAALGFKV